MAPMSMSRLGRNPSVNASSIGVMTMPLPSLDSGYASASWRMITSTSARASRSVTPSASRATMSQLWNRRSEANASPGTMGIQACASFRKVKPGGMTPTMVMGMPSTVMVSPMTGVPAPNRRW